MSDLLAQAIEKVARLPEAEQEVYASILLREMEEDAKWDAVFARNHEALEKLADQALDDYRNDRTWRLDI